jgi:hypothetical protein
MKVYGVAGTGPDGKQARFIVAARSRKAAVEAFQECGYRNMTNHFLTMYGAVSGNPTEIEVATADPGVVFVQADYYGAPYVPVEKKP